MWRLQTVSLGKQFQKRNQGFMSQHTGKKNFLGNCSNWLICQFTPTVAGSIKDILATKCSNLFSCLKKSFGGSTLNWHENNWAWKIGLCFLKITLLFSKRYQLSVRIFSQNVVYYTANIYLLPTILFCSNDCSVTYMTFLFPTFASKYCYEVCKAAR